MAAASYPPPAIMFSSDGHSRGHGRHSHSQTSILTTQRAALQPSVNGGGQPNGHILQNPLKPYTFPHFNDPLNTVELDVVPQQHSDTGTLQAEQHQSVATLNGTSESMERRRSSAGLPTHLRLGSSGYGFPLPRSPKYVSSNDGEATCDSA